MTQSVGPDCKFILYYTFKNTYKIGPASETRHAMSWFTISVFVSSIPYIKTHPDY